MINDDAVPHLLCEDGLPMSLARLASKLVPASAPEPLFEGLNLFLCQHDVRWHGRSLYGSLVAWAKREQVVNAAAILRRSASAPQWLCISPSGLLGCVIQLGDIRAGERALVTSDLLEALVLHAGTGIPCTCCLIAQNIPQAARWIADQGGRPMPAMTRDEAEKCVSLGLVESTARFVAPPVGFSSFFEAKDLSDTFAEQLAPRHVPQTEPVRTRPRPAGAMHVGHVSGQPLHSEVVSYMARHLILSKDQAFGSTLWIFASHCYLLFPTFPKLAVVSPSYGFGKTTFLKVTGRLANRTFSASNVSEAGLFRTIQMHPGLTLLIDELDTFGGSAGLRGILNSSHDEELASVIRIGRKGIPEVFNTFGPQVFGFKGTLHESLRQRSIEICMRQKDPTVRVAKLPKENEDGEADLLRRRIQAFVSVREQDIRAAYENTELPFLPSSRDQDNWRPLVAIAKAIGESVRERVIEAAKYLCRSHAGQLVDSDRLLRLTTEIVRQQSAAAAFDGPSSRSGLGGRLPTAIVLQELAAMDELPECFGDSGSLAAAQRLAATLEQHDVRPRSARASGYAGSVSCYFLADLERALARLGRLDDVAT
ncbi:DUF3631 domain-containing protein [Inhella sp.]|uniref:DUF3631 domain-containing protein n=1 Tax=Inhella sp. TaxID=1921806 RepID=UPI0035B38B37